jgi:hypothetical protein
MELISSKYRFVATMDFSEVECRAGLMVIKSHLAEQLRRCYGVDSADWEERLSVLTGCRPSKILLHVIAGGLYCDSHLLVMPLLPFEVARSFVKENLWWVLERAEAVAASHHGCQLVPEDATEGRFWFRALMLVSLLAEREALADGRYVFAGDNDCLFDEAIYSSNHLSGGPGGCKAEKP